MGPKQGQEWAILRRRQKNQRRCKPSSHSPHSPSFQLGSNRTSHQSQQKTTHDLKPRSDLLFPKGCGLNLWVLPASFVPLRSSPSGGLRGSGRALTAAPSGSAETRRLPDLPFKQKNTQKGKNETNSSKRNTRRGRRASRSSGKSPGLKAFLTLSLQGRFSPWNRFHILRWINSHKTELEQREKQPKFHIRVC